MRLTSKVTVGLVGARSVRSHAQVAQPSRVVGNGAVVVGGGSTNAQVFRPTPATILSPVLQLCTARQGTTSWLFHWTRDGLRHLNGHARRDHMFHSMSGTMSARVNPLVHGWCLTYTLTPSCPSGSLIRPAPSILSAMFAPRRPFEKIRGASQGATTA